VRSPSAIDSATLKICKLDDLYTEVLTHPPQINTYAVVGKETGYRGRQRYPHDGCYLAATVGKKAHLGTK